MKKHLLESLIVTASVFIIMSLFALIPISLGFLNPIGKAVRDFDIYDLVFSKLRADRLADTSIVLVNIGNMDRIGIAEQISIINSYEPKVVGLDVFFPFSQAGPQDSLLNAALRGCRKLVVASQLENYNFISNSYDSLLNSSEVLKLDYNTGFANLPEDDSEGLKTIRNFRPVVNLRHGIEYAFAVQVAAQADSDAVKKLKERGKELELINYRGNIEKFFFLDTYDVFDRKVNLNFIRNKIVLIGYMGEDLHRRTLEDIFFTPMNEKFAGRTYPDMYGVVINANIISMLLKSNFIDVMPGGLSLLLAIVICYWSAFIMIRIKKVYKDYFGAVFKLLIFTLTMLDLVSGVFIFNRYNYKINLTLTLVAIVLIPTCLDLYQIFLEKRIFVPKEKKEHAS